MGQQTLFEKIGVQYEEKVIDFSQYIESNRGTND